MRASIMGKNTFCYLKKKGAVSRRGTAGPAGQNEEGVKISIYREKTKPRDWGVEKSSSEGVRRKPSKISLSVENGFSIRGMEKRTLRLILSKRRLYKELSVRDKRNQTPLGGDLAVDTGKTYLQEAKKASGMAWSRKSLPVLFGEKGGRGGLEGD